MEAALEEEPVSGPHRRCAVTGEIRPKDELLRFVVAPDGTVVADIAGRLPGRGIWLCARRDVVNTAVAKRTFARAARRPAIAPADLADRIEVLLIRRCLEAIGLARRAGRAVCGFEKVRAEFKAHRSALLVEARDGGTDGDRMRALATGVPVVQVLDAAELGPVFGRDRAVHVAMAPGRLAAMLWRDARLLAGIRTGALVTGEGSIGEGVAGKDAPDEVSGRAART